MDESRAIGVGGRATRRRSNHAGGVAVGSRALNTAPRFRVGDTDSYKIAAIVDKAIAEADAAQREPL